MVFTLAAGWRKTTNLIRNSNSGIALVHKKFTLFILYKVNPIIFLARLGASFMYPLKKSPVIIASIPR